MSKPKLILVAVLSLSMMLGACANGNDTGNQDTNITESGGSQAGTNEPSDTEHQDEINDADQSGGDGEDNQEVDQEQNGNGTDADDGDGAAGTLTADGMIDQMLEQIEQPALMKLDDEMIEQTYGLDVGLLEEYSIRIPLMNVKTNEIAILKVKDANDIPTVQESLEKRATDVQKQFEQYLPDQYENAKNYQIIIEGQYVLFVISESADQLIEAFQSLI